MTDNLFKTELETHFNNRKITCFKRRHQSPLDVFNQIVAIAPNQEAVIAGDSRLTYQALNGLSIRFASALSAKGLKAGDRVAIHTSNRIEFIVAIIACLKAGYISVPIEPSCQGDALIKRYENAGVSAVLFDEMTASFQPKMASIKSIKQYISVKCKELDIPGAVDFYNFILSPAIDLSNQEINEETCATILYSDDNGDDTKGAMITHMNIVHSVMHLVKELDLHSNEVTIAAKPLSQASSFITQLYLMIACAGKLVLLKKFNKKQFITLAEAEQMTYSVLSREQHQSLLKQDGLKDKTLPSWRFDLFEAGELKEKLKKELVEQQPKLKLYNYYSATEATCLITIAPYEKQHDENTIGKVVKCGKIKIVDKKGKMVKPKEVGELWIKGPMVIPSYWNNEKATKSAFKDGFWKSGQMGFLDDDGHYHLVK